MAMIVVVENHVCYEGVVSVYQRPKFAGGDVVDLMTEYGRSAP